MPYGIQCILMPSQIITYLLLCVYAQPSIYRALLKHDSKLPEERKKELMETVADYFECEVSEINQSLIECASQVDPK